MIFGILVAGLPGGGGVWTLADTVRGSAGPGLPPDMGREPARQAMRDEAAVIAHRFWRKPIAADRLNELLAAIGGHNPRGGGCVSSTGSSRHSVHSHPRPRLSPPRNRAAAGSGGRPARMEYLLKEADDNADRRASEHGR